MKVCVIGLRNFDFPENVFKDFLNYLQSEMALRDELRIVLCKSREGQMTTGVRNPNEIRVLGGGRLLIDIFRTIAHEWVHEFQYQKLGLSDEHKVPDIGGPVENMASVLASIFLKKFQNNFPEYDKELYQEN